MEKIINNALPSTIKVPPQQISTWIPALGDNVPITTESMIIGLQNTGIDLKYHDATFTISFEELVVTLNPDNPTPINLTVNGCSYDLSGSITLKQAYLELPESNENCEYSTAVFSLQSIQNNIAVKAHDFCPRANNMLRIANNIPFWAEEPFVGTIAQKIIVSQFNQLEIVIGSSAYKLCTEYKENQLKFVLKSVLEL